MIDRAIDGTQPGSVTCPATEADVAAIVSDLSGGDWAVPVGGGTALTTGNVIDGAPVALDTTALSGIIEYEPADLTVSVRSGTRWSDLMRTLGENGQTVPIDVPLPDQATVGGVVATGWAGPRRLRDGTIKDLLIGASFVTGAGVAAKAGGMVVKNVSGFEVPRLLHGSYGSLAVITSVNLKVVPLHESELTLRSTLLPMVPIVREVLALTRREPALASAVVDGDASEGRATIRLTGRQAPVRLLGDQVRKMYPEWFTEPALEDDASAASWQDMIDGVAATDQDRVVIELGCSPGAVEDVVAMLAQEQPDDARMIVSPGVGSVTVLSPSDALSLAGWRSMLVATGLATRARRVVLHAPYAWRAGDNVWDIPDDQARLMAALKGQFDPHHRLNRGRLWDRVPEHA